MARLRWDPGITFQTLVLEPDFDDRPCAHCGKFTHIYEHRDRRLYLLSGPTRLVSKIAHCMDKGCPGHQEVVASATEMHLAPPFWTIGWDVFAWMGHRRFARHCVFRPTRPPIPPAPGQPFQSTRARSERSDGIPLRSGLGAHLSQRGDAWMISPCLPSSLRALSTS